MDIGAFETQSMALAVDNDWDVVAADYSLLDVHGVLDSPPAPAGTSEKPCSAVVATGTDDATRVCTKSWQLVQTAVHCGQFGG